VQSQKVLVLQRKDSVVNRSLRPVVFLRLSEQTTNRFNLKALR
jgi:hypothetical protein